MKKLLIITLILCLFLSACGGNNPDVTTELDAMQSQIDGFQKEIDFVKTEYKILNYKLENILQEISDVQSVAVDELLAAIASVTDLRESLTGPDGTVAEYMTGIDERIEKMENSLKTTIEAMAVLIERVKAIENYLASR